MARQFTAHQQAAVDARGHNILVSASAGSGKTTVLVERVIQEILQGTDLDQLLVVTFTEAAAAEMRQRIQAALEAQLKKLAPGTKQQRLRRQLGLLGSAQISTLHAFCLRVIQRYYYVIDLDPNFRLLTDDTEQLLLREDVWTDLREKLYATSPSFPQLVQNFSNDRSDDGLTDLVYRLFDFANANPDPAAWLNALPQAYVVGNQPLTETPFYQQQLRPYLESELMQAQRDLASALNVVQAQPDLEKFGPVLTKDQANLATLRQTVAEGDWDSIQKALTSFKFQRAPSLRNLEPAVLAAKNTVATYRDQAKKTVTALATAYFQLPAEDTQQIMVAAGTLVQQLVEVVQQFQTAFAQAKRQRQVLDFSDLEHLTLAILNAPNGQQVQANLQQQFQEVLVDEYQDINRLQETILTTVSQATPGNRFMVGDVKQSIYAFRLADPSLFLKKYQAFAGTETPDQRIILAENFRSAPAVTDFVNLIFSQLMDETVGEMPYDDAARLIPGAKYPELSAQPELLLYTADEKTGPDKTQGQLQMVGQKIQDLVAHGQLYDRKTQQMRAVTYGNIALLAPTRKNNLALTETFKVMGIPLVVANTENYFQTTEVQIMLSLLQIIDNPYQDIPLAAVLRSPIVGLKENELAALRINQRTGDYYQAVLAFQKWAVTGSFEGKLQQKLTRFLGQLTQFRQLARQNQLVTLIWTIYQETGFLDYVGGMPAGAQRQANLHALYERAHAYEASSFKGLFQFVRFIEKMQEKDQDLAEAPTVSQENAVALMTIHSSKGLEFPIVFLMDGNHQFNQASLRQDYVLDDRYGMGITYLEPTERVKVPTPQQALLRTQVQQRQAAEEMRLLYVALTRAEQQLYLVGTYPSQEAAVAKWQRGLQSQHLVLNDSLRRDTNNFMDWLGYCLVRQPQFPQQWLDQGQPAPVLADDQTAFKITFVQPQDLAQLATTMAPQQADNDWRLPLKPADLTTIDVDQIQQVLNLQYPYQASTSTTAYQSVSEVKQLFADPDVLEMNQLDLQTPQGKRRYVQQDFATPQFLQTTRQPTPAEIGTATHLVLQQVDLTHQPTLASLGETVATLVAQGLLTTEVAHKIELPTLMTFFDSSLGQQLLAQPTAVKREMPFSLLLPAQQLFQELPASEDTQVLIHGIMDGYLVTPDDVILFDYKTDHVGLKQPAKRQALLKERYRGQINLYAAALAQLLQRPVTQRYLYLLASGDLLAV
jgi:ATP-dependent helicase/nuclease subunit A